MKDSWLSSFCLSRKLILNLLFFGGSANYTRRWINLIVLLNVFTLCFCTDISHLKLEDNSDKLSLILPCFWSNHCLRWQWGTLVLGKIWFLDKFEISVKTLESETNHTVGGVGTSEIFEQMMLNFLCFKFSLFSLKLRQYEWICETN